MIEKCIKSNLKKIKRQYVNRQIEAERKREEDIVVGQLDDSDFEPLTQSEKDAFCKLWSPVATSFSFREMERYKKLNGFDPRYMPHQLYLPLIARRLNDYRLTKILEHKAMAGWISANTKQCPLRFPYCYIRKINGSYYNNEMEEISEEQAVKNLLDAPLFIIKPAIDSANGNGVKKVKPTDEASLRKLLSEYKDNCVAQEAIRQSEFTSQFNRDSVNTFRVETLYLNGKTTVCCNIFRFGMPGSLTDNVGGGGCAIQVVDGVLCNQAITAKHEIVTKVNGLDLSEKFIIPNMKAIEEILVKCHALLYPFSHFNGWDIALDTNNQPVVIEVNTSQPGVAFEQELCGPIFGDRTQEVIDYCKTKDFNYNKSLLQY